MYHDASPSVLDLGPQAVSCQSPKWRQFPPSLFFFSAPWRFEESCRNRQSCFKTSPHYLNWLDSCHWHITARLKRCDAQWKYRASGCCSWMAFAQSLRWPDMWLVHCSSDLSDFAAKVPCSLSDSLEFFCKSTPGSARITGWEVTSTYLKAEWNFFPGSEYWCALRTKNREIYRVFEKKAKEHDGQTLKIPHKWRGSGMQALN